ncbi:MAG TPA: hypothetical protein VIK27_12520 [Candidatus Aquilonibacter sp.]
MLRRVDADDRPQPAASSRPAPIESESVVPATPESAFDTSLLPRDHPPWSKDAVTISQRARELIARLRPAVVAVLTFWDHRVRGAFVSGNRISIDPSGSYRVE